MAPEGSTPQEETSTAEALDSVKRRRRRELSPVVWKPAGHPELGATAARRFSESARRRRGMSRDEGDRDQLPALGLLAGRGRFGFVAEVRFLVRASRAMPLSCGHRWSWLGSFLGLGLKVVG